MSTVQNRILNNVDPDLIDKNPVNPRLIFREAEMNQLLESIHEVGIQVPLSVFERDNRFVLLDGERRWRCARKLNLATVPVLALGSRAKAVKDQVARFNASDRKGALQSMCEIVEFETDKLVTKLARKGLISKTEGEVAKMDWATQINISASQTVHISGNPLVSESLKTDLHSFRGARNLINHKVSSKRDEQKREQQFAERMLMGPRLTADLLSLQRKAK